MTVHLTPSKMLSQRVSIALVGCGGNGSQMLTGLARLNHAIVALGHPGLDVHAFDPDTVSEANMGRQLFGSFDVGASKSITLVHRVNAFFGLSWKASFSKFEGDHGYFDIIICCVDSARARYEINRILLRAQPRYLMDLGNRAADGQVLFGEHAQKPREGSTSLPHPYDVLPELVNYLAVEDDTPSCGLAEALERQELFINQSVVTPALSILWEFFRYGKLTWHGAFVNLRTGSMRPLPVRAQPAESKQRVKVRT